MNFENPKLSEEKTLDIGEKSPLRFSDGGKTKTTSSERGGVDSDNPSSESLLQEGSERLSPNALASPPKDDAKLRKNTETTLRSIRKIQNKGGLSKKTGTPSQAVSALGRELRMEKSQSSQSYYGDYYEGDFEIDGTTVHVRISTHPANGERMGNADADDKVSIREFGIRKLLKKL